MKQINERTMTAVTAALLALCLCAAVLLGFVGYGREENEQTDGGSHIITEDTPLDGVSSPDETSDESSDEIPDDGESGENRPDEVETVPTLTDFLRAAMEPVGQCLYIYGGGWNEADDGAGIEAMTKGVSPRWKEFFDAHDEWYNYEDYLYNIHDGLDCTGLLGYAAYQVFGDRYSDSGYVFTSGTVGENYLRLFGGTLTPADETDKHRVGDIMVTNGHVWLSFGECADGSVLILHSSPPNPTFSGTPVPGKQNGLSVSLAERAMTAYAPEAYARYPHNCVRDMSFLTDYDRYTFPESVLPDRDGLREMSADEVVAFLLGTNE